LTDFRSRLFAYAVSKQNPRTSWIHGCIPTEAVSEHDLERGGMHAVESGWVLAVCEAVDLVHNRGTEKMFWVKRITLDYTI